MIANKKFFNVNDARALIDVYGFALFPIHGVIDGRCTCGAYPCGENNRSAGKHPACPNGFKDATKNIDQLKVLWDGRKHLNVGIATGAVSNCFVIDIDGEQGERDLADWGGLPVTLTSRTGRGRHLFFKHPGGNVKSRSAIIGTKVDVRGDGGYVVAPGSWHQSGSLYEWENPLEDILAGTEKINTLVSREKMLQLPTEAITAPAAPRPRLMVSNGWTEADVIEMLDHIDVNIGYSQWIDIGMALHSEGFGFNLWEDWSNKTRTAEHLRADPALHWRSFRAGGGVSFGTFVKMAQDGGWTRKKAPPDAVTGIPVTEQNQPLNHAGKPETKNLEKSARIEYTMANNIHPNLGSNDFVKGLLSESQLSVIYGESNCGKTFFATDLSFHIAMGREWRGRRVDKGGVVYAALEGSYGLRNRVQAFRVKHGLDDALFAMVASQVDFMDTKGNINDFIDCVKRAREEMGSLKMVVVDTLARAMAGGNENEGQDMGMLVHHADRIRYETGAHVCFIHHSGKDKARGARGHSSLRAAVDTEIEISRQDGADYSMIKIAKQREMEAGEDMFFKLDRVVIGVTNLTEELSSCVVLPVDKEDIVKPQQDHQLTSMQQFIYDAIVNALAKGGTVTIPRTGMYMVNCISYDELCHEMVARGFKEMPSGKSAKGVTNSNRIALRRAGKIDFTDDYIWLPKEKGELS